MDKKWERPEKKIKYVTSQIGFDSKEDDKGGPQDETVPPRTVFVLFFYITSG